MHLRPINLFGRPSHALKKSASEIPKPFLLSKTAQKGSLGLSLGGLKMNVKPTKLFPGNHQSSPHKHNLSSNPPKNA
jgi:hypothetical protein